VQHHDGYKVKTSWIRHRPVIRTGLTMNIHLGGWNPFQHDTDKDDDFADTDNIHWADNTQSIFCTSNPYVYMGLKWVMTRHFIPCYNKLYITLHFHVFLFWTWTTVSGRDKLILSPVLARVEGRTMPIAWRDCSRVTFVLILQMGHKHRDGTCWKITGPH
jgi:hypothetical protein